MGTDLEIIDVSFKKEFIESASNSVGIVTIETEINNTVMDAFPSLEFISAHGIGVEMVDVDAASERGIPVFNAPEYCLEEVTTHTLSLILACERRICQYNADVKSGGWDYDFECLTTQLSMKTVGVVGLGVIGLEVICRIEGFDVDTVGYDPYISESELRRHGIRKDDFESCVRTPMSLPSTHR